MDNITFPIEKLTSEFIDYINDYVKNNRSKATLLFKNTKDLFSNEIKKINSEHINFRIIGGLENSKYNEDRYIERSTYNVKEMYYIMLEIEKLEQGVDPNWSDLKKAIYLYDKLSKDVPVAYDYKLYDMKETQSLRGIYSGAICAGYSLIFKELMDRQNIKCDYVRGKTPVEGNSRHAWNVLEIDGKIIPVDCTWEACNRNKNDNEYEFIYFGATEQFIKQHIPDSDERIKNYKIEKISFEKEPEILDDIDFPQYYRKDGTSFHMALIDELNVNNKKIYKYIHSEEKDNIIYSELNMNEISDSEKYYFVNMVISNERVKRYVKNNKGYVGCLLFNEGKVNPYIDVNVKDEINMSKTHERNNGTSFIMIPTNNPNYFRVGVNEYEYIEVIKESGAIKYNKNNLYSELNVFNMDHKTEYLFNNLSMDRERIDKKINNNAGYIGTITKSGEYRKAIILGRDNEIKQIKNFNSIELQKLSAKDLADSKYSSLLYSQIENQEDNKVR